MESTSLEPGMTVEEVLERWPQTAAVFNHYKSACVGCALAPFCTLYDVATTYHLQLDRLMADLRTAVTGMKEQI